MNSKYVHLPIYKKPNMFLALTMEEESTLLERGVLQLACSAPVYWNVCPELVMQEHRTVTIRFKYGKKNSELNDTVEVSEGNVELFAHRVYTRQFISLKEQAILKEIRVCE